MHPKIFAAGLIAAVLLTAAAQTHASEQESRGKNVFGNDDREPLLNSDPGWRTIGKLCSLGGTGTLVGRDLVLTAAHCVIDESTGRLRNDIKYFHPNYKQGQSVDKSWITHVWCGTNAPSQNPAQDWAILRLAEPLGDKYGWLGIDRTTTYTIPAQISVVGYSANYEGGETAGIHHDGHVRNRRHAQGFILHDCDAGRGSSGGPALRKYNDELTIVGIATAEYRNGGASSLYVSSYADQYANIVIPSNDFARQVARLRAGADPMSPNPQPQPWTQPQPQTGWTKVGDVGGVQIWRDNVTKLEWTQTLGTVPSADRGSLALQMVGQHSFRLPTFDELRTITQHGGHGYLNIRMHLCSCYETDDPNVLGNPHGNGFQTRQPRIGILNNYVIGVR